MYIFQSRNNAVFISLAFVFLISTIVVFAQSSDITVIPVECGTVIEGELTASEPFIMYSLHARAGTKIRGVLEPFGTTFNPVATFFDSADEEFLAINEQPAGGIEDFTGIELSVSNPTIAVYGASTRKTGDPASGIAHSMSWIIPGLTGGSFGAYTLSIGCQLRDGTIINPGESASVAQNDPVPALAFSGNGFPGLAPVDFSDAILIPFNFDAPNSSGFAPSFDAVFGYTFDARANDVFTLDFTRLSGNLNLGLAVLTSDNKIIFEASLVTSDTLSTRFTLPSDGTYTVGVYNIDLLPPDSPENTAFQITGTINP